MCGRYAPGSGTNGNGHAKKHYEDTGYPLVVKLSTIENGDGDVHSYEEDVKSCLTVSTYLFFIGFGP